MAMAVVQIRPVRVGVRHRVMVMPVRMFHRRVKPMMFMRMMPVVVGVAMGVAQFRMIVRMGVVFGQQQRDPHHEQQRSDDMQAVQRLT